VSVVVQVTVVAPGGNAEPDGGAQVTEATAQLSLVVGAGYVTVPEPPPLHSEPMETVMSGGQLIVGSSVSLTETVKLQLASLSALSLAMQVTVVVPIGKAEPDGGVQVRVAPGQLSVTLAL
jgi:hypothetical protein